MEPDEEEEKNAAAEQVSVAMSNPDELIEEQDKKRPDVSHIDFSVEYIHAESMPRSVIQILGRKTEEIEEAYQATCGKVLRLVRILHILKPKQRKA